MCEINVWDLLFVNGSKHKLWLYYVIYSATVTTQRFFFKWIIPYLRFKENLHLEWGLKVESYNTPNGWSRGVIMGNFWPGYFSLNYHKRWWQYFVIRNKKFRLVGKQIRWILIWVWNISNYRNMFILLVLHSCLSVIFWFSKKICSPVTQSLNFGFRFFFVVYVRFACLQS